MTKTVRTDERSEQTMHEIKDPNMTEGSRDEAGRPRQIMDRGQTRENVAKADACKRHRQLNDGKEARTQRSFVGTSGRHEGEQECRPGVVGGHHK